MQLASYSDRFLAGIIDGFISAFIANLISIPLMVMLVWQFISPKEVFDCGDNLFFYGTCTSTFSINWFLVALLMFGMFAVYVVVAIFYYVRRPAKNRGQTYAKSWFKIRVVREDEIEVTMQTLLVRFVVWQLFATFISLFVYVTMFFTDKRQTVYDLIVKTKVVKMTI